jgi:hypothetical protein
VSRLETHIRRLQAQRACLDALARAVAPVPGPVVELGLGNGRTYDHLRERLPERAIFVFERDPRAHPACIPDDRHLIVGDLEATLPHALDRLPAPAALVHSDIGTGDEAATARLAAWLATAIPPITAPGGFVASDQPLDHPRLAPWPLPDEVSPGRYHLYRVGT